MSTTSCVRCSLFGLQCTSVVISSLQSLGKHVCHQCNVAGNFDCIFTPAIRYTSTHVNTACVCCIMHHKKCTFENENDVKCTRCHARNALCRFRMSGKKISLISYNLFLVYWLLIWLLSARVTCLKATMSCPQCYPSPCDRPHNVFIKTVPPLLGACNFYQWRELLPLYASCGGCVYVSVQYHEDCHSASYVDFWSPFQKIVGGFS